MTHQIALAVSISLFFTAPTFANTKRTVELQDLMATEAQGPSTALSDYISSSVEEARTLANEVLQITHPQQRDPSGSLADSSF